MPGLRSLALCSLFAYGTIAASTEKRMNGYCLSNNEAQTIATNWGSLIANYSETLANATLTETFTDYSESVNTLINSCPQGSAAMTLPLLAPTFINRATFNLGQGQQPSISFRQLNIWHSCDTVVIRWLTTNTAPIAGVKPVVGLISLETVKAPKDNEYTYLIDTVYSEFDAGAWLQNLVAAGICPSDAGLSPPSGPAPTELSTMPTASATQGSGSIPSTFTSQSNVTAANTGPTTLSTVHY